MSKQDDDIIPLEIAIGGKCFIYVNGTRRPIAPSDIKMDPKYYSEDEFCNVYKDLVCLKYNHKSYQCIRSDNVVRDANNQRQKK
jgi:hypothetical protein